MRRGSVSLPCATDANEPIFIPTIWSRSNTSTSTASCASAISRARAARNSGLQTFDGRFWRSRAAFCAVAVTRAVRDAETAADVAAMYERMRDDMDLDAGTILSEGRSVEEVGEEIFQRILAIASGERPKSEQLGLGDEEFQPWILGPVL